MRRRQQRRFVLTLLALAMLTMSVTACGDDDAATDAVTADGAAFCAHVSELSGEVPESYVGSAEHVDDLRQLSVEAPAEVRDDVDLITNHFDTAVDPSDPDSQLAENFPDAVNEAIGRFVTYIDEHCVD